MDNYPAKHAPRINASGSVNTPFEEWWARASAAFPAVPEEVARYWLYEHWGQSPFGWLPSSEYKFELEDWPSQDLSQIRSGWCDWDSSNAGCLEHGGYLIEELTGNGGYEYPTARYMLDRKDFPVPPIVLDNRDGHLSNDPHNPGSDKMPAAFVLIEGHRRFNMALYLRSTKRFAPIVKLWLMRRAVPDATRPRER